MRSRFRATTLLGSLLAVMIIASLVLMGFIIERFVRAELRRQAEEGNRLLASSVAHEIFSFLDAHFWALSLLESPEFRDANGAELLQRNYPAFETVLLADRRGVVVQASSNSGELGFDLSARDYFRVPFDAQTDFVSPPFISETRYSPSAVLSRPFPGGVAIAYIGLGFMSEFIAGLPSGESKSIAVVDANGFFVGQNTVAAIVGRSAIVSLEPWFQEHTAGKGNGLSIVTGPDGVEELLCWTTVPGVSGWTVIVAEPTRRVFRAVYFLRTALAFVLAAYAIVSLLLNLSVVRFVRSDIATLVRFSQEIADGKLAASIDFRGFYDFAHLAANLERMGAAIRERESSLKTNERRLFDLLDFLPIPVILLTRNWSVVLMNQALTRTLGWTRLDIQTDADWWQAAYSDKDYRQKSKEFWLRYLDALHDGARPKEPFKGSLRCKDGSFRTVLGEAALIADRIIITFVDITEADEAATRTIASLKEKEVLLKEIHHRVKNNLQVVISLLTLRAATTPETSHLFGDSIDRIQVMAGIHELLYKSKDLSHISLSEYVETILYWLMSTYTVGPIQPKLELCLEPIELGIDKSIPCGLIMNEVITNSLKYAFKTGASDPKIQVSATRAEKGRILIVLSDNGVGLPSDLDPTHSDSLGMQLIMSLCSQIDATWKLDSSAGTTWTIGFEA